MMIDLIIPPNVGSLKELRKILAFRERLKPDDETASEIDMAAIMDPDSGNMLPHWNRQKAAELGVEDFEMSDEEVGYVGEGLALMIARNSLNTRDQTFLYVLDLFEEHIPDD